MSGQRFRLGGLVETGSIIKGEGMMVSFDVTDTVKAIRVSYKGQLPDLFREGQGFVTEGRLDTSGKFIADTVLAKHDETYMPKDLADRLMEKVFGKESPNRPCAPHSRSPIQGTLRLACQ